MTRAELRRHCHEELTWYIDRPENKRYQEHLLVLSLLNETEWVSVNDGSPKENELVLVYINTGTSHTYFLALWNEFYKDWEEGVGGSRLLKKDLGYEVIKWMSLPKV